MNAIRARCGRERGGLVKKRGRLCTAGSMHWTGGDRRAVFGLERRVASPHVNHAGPCAGCAGCGLPREGKGEQSQGEGLGCGGAQDAAPSGTERERSALEYRSAAACSLGPVAIRGS